MLSLLQFVPLLLAVPYSTAVAHVGHSNVGKAHARHRNVNETDIALRAPHELSRRADNARFSWFVTGLGACGNTNSPSDFIVAMSKGQFDAEDHCGQTITITYKGKTAQATIQDRCEKCPYNGLDFTSGLFSYFVPGQDIYAVGELFGSWEYGSGKPAPVPETTTKKEPEAVTTKAPKPSTTLTSTTTTTSATSSHSESLTSSSSSHSSTSISTSSSAPETSSSTASQPGTSQVAEGTLAQINLAMIGLGQIIVVGARGTA